MTVVAVRVRGWTARQPVPRNASGDGIAYGVIGVGESLAAAVVGAGQAVEFVPCAALQGGFSLIGVGDDVGGGGVDGAAGGRDVIGPDQGVGHHAIADAQGHGIDSGPGVDVGVGQSQGVANDPVAVGPQGTGDDLRWGGQVGEGHRQRCGAQVGHQGLTRSHAYS
jgi:hypothetical protein